MLIDFHRRMLADRVRHDAYRAALAYHLGRGARTVADIGAGTGVLSFFARELGARECWLYEPGAVLALAEAIAARNGIDGLHFVPLHSVSVEDPDQVDLVVAEVFGNFALEEGVLDTLADAHRFLVPGGALCPAALQQFVAPVVSDRFARELGTWAEVGHGLDLQDAHAVGVDNMYVYAIEPDDLLAQPDAAQRWDALEFTPTVSGRRAGRVAWTLAADGPVHGFALWWEALLAPGVSLSTSPHAPRTHWDQVYLPLRTPLAGRACDAIALELECEVGGGEAGIAVRWNAEQSRGGARVDRRAHDIARGFVD
jgi:protein arginine N-methyltransferase 1